MTTPGTELTRSEILEQVAAGELGPEVAEQLFQALAERERHALQCRISQRGAVSVYGLQRFPVTLYADQWRRLLAFFPQIESFILEHAGEVKWQDGARSRDLFFRQAHAQPLPEGCVPKAEARE